MNAEDRDQDVLIVENPSIFDRLKHFIRHNLGITIAVVGAFVVLFVFSFASASSPSATTSNPITASTTISTSSPHGSESPSRFEHPSTNSVSPLQMDQNQCGGPFPGYPFCQGRMEWMEKNWNINAGNEAYYRSKGVDGSKCSILNFLHDNGFYCPAAEDLNLVNNAANKIRGVNIGGWLVLEPWITPSLFEQFPVEKNVEDMWKFCEVLGRTECERQLKHHYETFLTEDDLKTLSENGINHIRIPVGYWSFGEVKEDEPYPTDSNSVYYLSRALHWAKKYGLRVVIDLHAAPGSQNGFDNSGRKGEIHWADSQVVNITTPSGRQEQRTIYPNINRTLQVIRNMTQFVTRPEFEGVVVAVELVNEAFITIPIEIVKDFYLRGYDVVHSVADLAVIIGDSFRFGEWGDFMYPPHYRHVWIDTHVYQLFDTYRLSMSHAQHLEHTCSVHKPQIAVAPLSTMVGEWTLAITDCAQWLNGYNTGARFEGTLAASPNPRIGSCDGMNDYNHPRWKDPENVKFLREYAEKQMDAYESGSSAGWFFWNFKTEKAPDWNYLWAIKQGWVPTDHSKRTFKC